MRRMSVRKVLMLIGLTMTTLAAPAWGQYESREQGRTCSYSFSYTPIYQFETDLDRGGRFDVSRHYLRLNFVRPINRKLKLGLGLGYDFEKWNFSDLPDVAGASPWDALHRPAVSVPVLYAFADSWTLGITPTIEYSGESGADFGQSLIYGGIVSLAHPFSRNLYLGIGVGIFDQLEETSFFPFIIVNWKINDKFQITNPFRAGPAGPAGLELVYVPTENWELGIGGAYRTYRFRLDDRNLVRSGVGENKFLVGFLRVQRKIGERLTIDLAGGALFGGDLSIENEDGNEIESDEYDSAPFLALTFGGRF
jgi:hypothetical protein